MALSKGVLCFEGMYVGYRGTYLCECGVQGLPANMDVVMVYT